MFQRTSAIARTSASVKYSSLRSLSSPHQPPSSQVATATTTTRLQPVTPTNSTIQGVSPTTTSPPTIQDSTFGVLSQSRRHFSLRDEFNKRANANQKKYTQADTNLHAEHAKNMQETRIALLDSKTRKTVEKLKQAHPDGKITPYDPSVVRVSDVAIPEKKDSFSNESIKDLVVRCSLVVSVLGRLYLLDLLLRCLYMLVGGKKLRQR
jgi:hypothetical protein